MEFSRQEDWSGSPFPPPGDLPDSGIEPTPPALAGKFFTAEPPGKSPLIIYVHTYVYIIRFLFKILDSTVKG